MVRIEKFPNVDFCIMISVITIKVKLSKTKMMVTRLDPMGCIVIDMATCGLNFTAQQSPVSIISWLYGILRAGLSRANILLKSLGVSLHIQRSRMLINANPTVAESSMNRYNVETLIIQNVI